VILAGDFNATPWSDSFQQLVAQTGLRNVHQGALFEATWSAALPQRLLIDHVLLSPEWDLAAKTIGPDIGSDHRAVIVDLLKFR
jgi:endonuclease/exonuclease/phosphatase (EEP) superfamily protein YafD